jgi:hypothetical protein
MINSEELIGTTEYLTLYTRCRINPFRYNRVPLYIWLCKKKVGNFLTSCVTNSMSMIYIPHGVLLKQLIVSQLATFYSAAGNIRSPHLQRGRRLPHCCKREDSQEQCSSGLYKVTSAFFHPETSGVHPGWVPSGTKCYTQSYLEVTMQLVPRQATSFQRT